MFVRSILNVVSVAQMQEELLRRAIARNGLLIADVEKRFHAMRAKQVRRVQELGRIVMNREEPR